MAVVLVFTYLGGLNVVVVAVGLWHVFTAPQVITDWTEALTTEHGNPFMMIAIALVVFPKLALGLSGFETGVAVMPHVKGDPDDTAAKLLCIRCGSWSMNSCHALPVTVPARWTMRIRSPGARAATPLRRLRAAASSRAAASGQEHLLTGRRGARGGNDRADMLENPSPGGKAFTFSACGTSMAYS